MSWRPDDWPEIKPETTPLLGIMANKALPNNIFQAGVEAGADAMLEALKAKGVNGHWTQVESPGGEYWQIDVESEKGWLVFIPEETKGG